MVPKTHKSQETVVIGYMEDSGSLISGGDGEKVKKKLYKEDRGIIKISNYRKRLSDTLNEQDKFIEYENHIGQLVTINKAAILFIVLSGSKEVLNYRGSEIRIFMKRGVRFKGVINTEGTINYRQALEKRHFIPVDFKQSGVIKTAIVNRDNIMRIIEEDISTDE